MITQCKSLKNVELLPKEQMINIKEKSPELMQWWSVEKDEHSEEYFSEELEKLSLKLDSIMSPSYNLETSTTKKQKAIIEIIRPDLFK